MILVELFKGLFVAFFHIARSLWRAGGRKLRLSIAVVILAVLAVLVGKRAQNAFTERPPAWLRQQEFASPALSKAAWNQFQQMLEQGQRYALQRGLPLGAVRLVEIQGDLTNALVWTTDPFVNPGFNPLSHMERSLWLKPAQFVGYYASDGTPLHVTLKHTPTQTNSLLMTVSLPAPVAPGATAITFRLERQFDRVKPTPDGKFQVGFGRMPGPNAAIHSWGICLPEEARLLHCVPEQGATIVTNEAVHISWINARLPTSAPPISLVFTAPK